MSLQEVDLASRVIHLGFSSRSLISQEAFRSSDEKSVSWQALPRPWKQGQGRAESHRKNLGIHSHPQSCLDSFQSLIKAPCWEGKTIPPPCLWAGGPRSCLCQAHVSHNKAHSCTFSISFSFSKRLALSAIPRASGSSLRVCFPALLGLSARPA